MNKLDVVIGEALAKRLSEVRRFEMNPHCDERLDIIADTIAEYRDAHPGEDLAPLMCSGEQQ